MDNSTRCDCCMGSWLDEPNEVGFCHCWCSHCDEQMCECKYECNFYKPKVYKCIKAKPNSEM